MYQYLPVENKTNSPYIGNYRTFGLRVLQGDEELMIMPDISTDFAFTLRLASLFTRKQLSPLHLLDVLEDML